MAGEKEKSNKGLIILLAVLLVVIVGLGVGIGVVKMRGDESGVDVEIEYFDGGYSYSIPASAYYEEERE